MVGCVKTIWLELTDFGNLGLRLKHYSMEGRPRSQLKHSGHENPVPVPLLCGMGWRGTHLGNPHRAWFMALFFHSDANLLWVDASERVWLFAWLVLWASGALSS